MQMVESAKKDHEEKHATLEDIKFFNSFVLGQGSLYVLEDGNKAKINDELVDNGPKYQKRLWNTRKLDANAVKELLKTTADGATIYPEFQEFALTIAITKSLLDETTLAAHESGQFPRIVLANNKDGEILIVNGHHRIEAYQTVHEKLLTRLAAYRKNLRDLEVASDRDNNYTTQARSVCTDVEETLWKQGQWGAVFLDKGIFLCNIQKTIE